MQLKKRKKSKNKRRKEIKRPADRQPCGQLLLCRPRSVEAPEGSRPPTQAQGEVSSPLLRPQCPPPNVFLFNESCVYGLKGRVVPARKSLEPSAQRQPLKTEKTQPSEVEDTGSSPKLAT